MTDYGHVISSRHFTDDDQDWFALHSGDHNPLHVDPIAARRSMYGQQVVHGVHVLLWGVDAFLADRQGTVVSRLVASFKLPVLLEEQIDLQLAHLDEFGARLEIRRDDAILLTARLEFGDEVVWRPVDPEPGAGLPTTEPEPTGRDAANVEDARGRLELPYRGELEDRFQSVDAALGPRSSTRLAALSRLVGMECPGLHSVFAGLDLHVAPAADVCGMVWEVTRFDRRFGAVRMAITSANIAGVVDSFLRPEPTEQPRTLALSSSVAEGEFAGVRALIAGGSRGLGELAAKLIAVGGGRSLVTWHRGQHDADRVVRDIVDSGGDAASLPLDVARPTALTEHLAGEERPITHLLYFASPQIFVRRTLDFDPDLFDRFARVYVAGLIGVISAIRAAGCERLAVLNPSSVAVDEKPPDLLEYAAAKAASEVAAGAFASSSSWLRVHVARFPRLATDQTATLLPVPTADAVRTVLVALRSAR